MIDSAVVASDGNGHGAVLWYTGRFEEIIQEHGITDLNLLGMDDCPHGVHVWMGRVVWGREGGDDFDDYATYGEWRNLTPAEWAALQENRNPL